MHGPLVSKLLKVNVSSLIASEDKKAMSYGGQIFISSTARRFGIFLSLQNPSVFTRIVLNPFF